MTLLTKPLDADLLTAVVATMEEDSMDIPPEHGSEPLIRTLLGLPEDQDITPLVEIAVGRSMMCNGLATEADVEARQEEMMRGTQLFLDGFIAGVRYALQQERHA